MDSIIKDQKESEELKIYLAGLSGEKTRAGIEGDFKDKISILESFFYVKPWMDEYINKYWNFMLDSGAFSAIRGKTNGIDWDSYVDRYCEYINRLNINLFMELDIDSIVGLDKVKLYRAKIEAKTGKQVIPVWHKNRGMEDFQSMCREYSYVAIGGVVINEIKRKEYRFLPRLINIAHEHNTKIHGLGFTQSDLWRYKFDSVDSTAWIQGNIGGFIYQFTGKEMRKVLLKKDRRFDTKKVAIHNFLEWVKYQRYAETYL